jgi:hypothetical protein
MTCGPRVMTPCCFVSSYRRFGGTANPENHNPNCNRREILRCCDISSYYGGKYEMNALWYAVLCSVVEID